MTESINIKKEQTECQILYPTTKYKIYKTPIGKGAFSIVYKGISNEDIICAVKCISFNKLDDKKLRTLEFEFHVSQQLKHTHIVKCHEVFKTKKHWYLINEYCNNGTLEDVIKITKHCEYNKREEICKFYLTQLKSAMRYLHKNKITHRDLKPSNILVTKCDTTNNLIVKLADFGLSRYFYKSSLHTDNLMTSMCGTPIYMAPELLLGLKYDDKVDLWAFGVIMYEMLHDINPLHKSKTIKELFKKIENNELIVNDDYSQQCKDLINKLLVIDNNKRISWEDFFAHNWFDKKLRSIESMESPNLEHPQLFNIDVVGDKVIDEEISFNKSTYTPYQSCVSYNETYNKTQNKSSDNSYNKTIYYPTKETINNSVDLLEDEFIVIEDNDQVLEYNEYEETYTQSAIRIFNNSMCAIKGVLSSSFSKK
jgi:serine/threonine-protein kinase ULK2